MFAYSFLETCDLEENLEYITKYLAVTVSHIYQVLKIYNNLRNIFKQQYCIALIEENNSFLFH